MSQTWHSADPPPPSQISAAGWARVILRGGLLGAVVFGGLGVLLALRLIERPAFGEVRPITPHIAQFVCRSAFWILRFKRVVEGTPMTHSGALVANHGSWLDIFALFASDRVYFVSKAEVRKWPAIGWLARATGTVFINRARGEAGAHTKTLAARLRAGHRLMFFPEGTSTDGRRVLPFRSTLFQSFFTEDTAPTFIQPVSVYYSAPTGADARFYGWWGDMDFGSHLLRVLAQSPQGTVHLRFHAPLSVADYPDRKALAEAAGQHVAEGHRDLSGHRIPE